MSQQKSECHYPGCKENLLTSAKKGHCIFHARTEEKDTREFHKALENYVNRIKKAKDLDYNFMGFIFVGDIDFRSLLNQSVSKNVSFEAAEFHGTAHFDEIEFQKDFFFNQAEFHHGDVFFSRAKFHGETHFDSTRFEHADFVRVEFHGETHFWATRFGQGTHFMRAKFTARAYFSNSFIRGRVSFASATLENISLTPLNLDEDARIDFADARLRNTEITRQDIEDHIMQEREKFFPQAKEIYLLLKNNFHSLGRYDDESWAFKKEKDMERKSYFHFRFFPKWLGSMFWNILYGYGERLIFILGWCAGLIFFSSIWYWLYKGVGEMVGQQIVPLKGYLNYLYFSVITFTTLGYGDFRPRGGCKILASIEALLGIFFVALFIFTIARRTAGR